MTPETFLSISSKRVFPDGSVGKKLACNAGDTSLGHYHYLPYSRLTHSLLHLEAKLPGCPPSHELVTQDHHQEMQVRSLGWEDPLEKEMAIHSSILAWKIP